MTMTSYRQRKVVGVRILLPSTTTMLSGRVLRTRNDDNKQPSAVARRCVFITFSVQTLLCCPVTSWCTRNDDNDILPRTRRGGCLYPFDRRALPCCSGTTLVRSRLGARGMMTTTSYRSRSAVGVRHILPRRGTAAVRSRLVEGGTMTTTFYRIRVAVGVCHRFSVEALPLLSPSRLVARGQ
ncbi:hypothetical protein TNCV_688941 [Trichonephila clavipes]|nr:hypothetical protein TNCV_688941 [Trichonephila clavipes]